MYSNRKLPECAAGEMNGLWYTQAEHVLLWFERCGMLRSRTNDREGGLFFARRLSKSSRPSRSAVTKRFWVCLKGSLSRRACQHRELNHSEIGFMMHVSVWREFIDFDTSIITDEDPLLGLFY